MSLSQEQHEILAALKDLALELGRTPRRDDIRGTKISEHRISALFGSFGIAVQAAGLSAPKARKIDNSVFDCSVEKHLKAYAQRPIIERAPYPRIAVLSDVHWPFSSQRVIDAFYAFIEKNEPEWVILDGDAWDMYSHAKFPRSHNVFTPREERDLSRKANELFWQEVKKRVPLAKCRQLMGNHDVRIVKRILEAVPSAEHWIEEIMRKEFSFEGVETIFDPREELKIGDIMIHHGYKSKLGDHRDGNPGWNFICGHTHRGGVVYRQLRGQVFWELNCGYAGDPEAKGLTYTSQKSVDWTPGFGFVDEYGPRFISA